VKVTIKLGRLISIRVNDPGKLLPQKIGRHSGNELSLRIAGQSGLVHRIPIVSEDANGRDHAFVIPYDLAHKLSIQSTSFALKDENGQDYSTTGPRPVQAAHGDPDFRFIVNVTPKGTK
jgi:hypothetical protein